MTHTFAVRIGEITTKKISVDEAAHYLRQAIDLCYKSEWNKMPYEFKIWINKKIKINYLELPKDVQEGITGILFHSPKIKNIIQQFLINLPQQ